MDHRGGPRGKKISCTFGSLRWRSARAGPCAAPLQVHASTHRALPRVLAHPRLARHAPQPRDHRARDTCAAACTRGVLFFAGCVRRADAMRPSPSVRPCRAPHHRILHGVPACPRRLHAVAQCSRLLRCVLVHRACARTLRVHAPRGPVGVAMLRVHVMRPRPSPSAPRCIAPLPRSALRPSPDVPLSGRRRCLAAPFRQALHRPPPTTTTHRRKRREKNAF